MNVFFLKKVFSALMFFVYLHFQQIRLCRINALKEGKIMIAFYFLFILFRLF